MPSRLLLIEGPAGGGKSGEARRAVREGAVDVIADYTALWAAMLGIRRLGDGTYPIREPGEAVSSGFIFYMQRAVARSALRSGLRVAVTTDRPGTAPDWAGIARDHRAGFEVRTVDPGRAVVERRLARGGKLSPECSLRIQAWYRDRQERRREAKVQLVAVGRIPADAPLTDPLIKSRVNSNQRRRLV